MKQRCDCLTIYQQWEDKHEIEFYDRKRKQTAQEHFFIYFQPEVLRIIQSYGPDAFYEVVVKLPIRLRLSQLHLDPYIGSYCAYLQKFTGLFNSLLLALSYVPEFYQQLSGRLLSGEFRGEVLQGKEGFCLSALVIDLLGPSAAQPVSAYDYLYAVSVFTLNNFLR